MSVIIAPNGKYFVITGSTGYYSDYRYTNSSTSSSILASNYTDTASNYTYNGLDLMDLRETFDKYTYQSEFLQGPFPNNSTATELRSSFSLDSSNWRPLNSPYSHIELQRTYESKKFEIIRNLRNNLRPTFSQRGHIIKSDRENEQTAIETLREMITEKEFRKYIKYGFILVRGESGSVYQIFRDSWHTKVWKNGKIIEEVCVRLKSSVPPTDNIIAFKTLIESSERDFKQLGNVYKMAA